MLPCAYITYLVNTPSSTADITNCCYQLVSAIILFLLLLGSAHAQEIAAMLKADIEEIGGGSSYDSGTQDSSVYALPPHHYSNNEIRLHNGQHVALGKR
jgi:hypothetical protein